jgi:hypothetical protein
MKNLLLFAFCFIILLAVLLAELFGIKPAPQHKPNPAMAAYDYSDQQLASPTRRPIFFVWIGYADLNLITNRTPHTDWTMSLAAAGPLHDFQYGSNSPANPIEDSLYREWTLAAYHR